MKRFTFCMAVLATTALAGAVWAEPDTRKEQPSLRMELDLVDGSHIVGATSIESVPVETAYARINIPLRHILTIKTGDDHETAVIDL
ncbi:MAG: hypothetical protein FJ224_12700, partial [Lentisphaerae bacterium]|nr:hypothetical protein [Lentisphaerota bacterium]